MSKATFDDANLLLRLYDMRREPRLREARRWFAAKFKVKAYPEFSTVCPPGSEENASFRMLTTYWEMAASFVTSGILNPELFYQSSREMLMVWERVRDILPDMRAAYGNPHELRNLQQAAIAYIEWWNDQAPGSYEAFSKRIRG